MEKIFNIAGISSFVRGYDYFNHGNVVSVEQIDKTHYKMLVQGTMDEPYEVIFDTETPRKSTCTCPYCEGHPRRFCKHKVAAYFALNPENFKIVKERITARRLAYQEAIEESQRMFDEYITKKNKEIEEYIDSLTESQAKEILAKKLRNEACEYYYDSHPDEDDDDDYEELYYEDY